MKHFPDKIESVYLIPLRRRHNRTPKIRRIELSRWHCALKQPGPSAVYQLIRCSLGNKPLLTHLKKDLGNFRYSECAQTSNLPRESKFALSYEATPNLVVSLDVMPHVIRGKFFNIFVIVSHGDMLTSLKVLHNCTALTAFNAFYTYRLFILDAPISVIIDCGSSLAAEIMNGQLHEIEALLLPISTEIPWSIGLNKRSLRYLHNSIDRLRLQTDYDTGHHQKVLPSDIKMGWNFAQPYNSIIPHGHRFRTMPRSVRFLDENFWLCNLIGLI